MAEAQALLANDGLHIDALRVRAFPPALEIAELVREHEHVFVVEQNRDAQMRTLMTTDLERAPSQLISILHFGGMPITARFIAREVASRLRTRLGANVGPRFLTYLGTPKFHHPSAAVNELGYTRRDYEGSMSTLCAACGHDAISAAISHACFELSLPPHRSAKLSGIGCFSKTPTYVLGQSHGFNSVHGRMPSVLTGANLANRDLIYLGVSGDRDTASIGLGQFAHSIRRGVNIVYIVENNGVYGLTKGQFSATADRGSKSMKGAGALDQPIDLVGMAIGLCAAFVGRSFSGDKAQLVPLIRAAFEHKGVAFIDVLSPCVTFNNHAGSTKRFDYVREHNTAVNALDVTTGRDTIEMDYAEGGSQAVMMHDGSKIVLRKLDATYDCRDRSAALAMLERARVDGEIAPGLMYIDDDASELHEVLGTTERPLDELSERELCPGSKALDAINAPLR
jgi:2-oxoglutarate/2-oxoacid ferredoxin oxidoreductase subunit beta